MTADDAGVSPWDRSPDRWRGQPTVLGAVVLLLVAAAFWLLGGVWGLLTWLVVAAVWLAAPPVAAVAVAQFGLLALVPDGTLRPALTVEGALLCLLLVDVLEDTWSAAAGVVLVGAAVGLAGLGVGVIRSAGMLTALLAVGLAVAVGSYLLHRYLLLDVGAVEQADG